MHTYQIVVVFLILLSLYAGAGLTNQNYMYIESQTSKSSFDRNDSDSTLNKSYQTSVDIGVNKAKSQLLPMLIMDEDITTNNYTRTRNSSSEIYLKKKQSTVVSILSDKIPPSVKKLFRVFVFKGYGISIIKSTSTWNSFGFGWKVPITPNFPEYDRIVHLPRFSSSFGIFYPFDLKASMAVSFPLHAATVALAKYCTVLNCFILYSKIMFIHTL